MKTCGVVLVGGKGKRFGAEKVSLILEGKKILHIIVKELSEVCPEIILAGKKGIVVEGYDISCVEDIIKDRGPLAGIVSAMELSKSDFFIIVPCDMPFVCSSLFKLYIKYLHESDVTLSPKWGFPIGMRKEIYPFLRKALFSNSLCLFDVIKSSNFRIKVIPREEILSIGDEDIIFVNINTREDYNFALEMMKSVKG